MGDAAQGSFFRESVIRHGDVVISRLEPARARFDGESYDPAKDAVRLTGQLRAVWQVMRDGNYRTLPQIQLAVEVLTGKKPREQSISARLRDLRKPRFGGHTIDRRRVTGGVWEYALLNPANE